MKSRCICALLVGLLFPLQAIGQKISVQSIKSPQAFAAMQGRTGEIVLSLPGENVIEKEAVNGKTVLYSLDRKGKRTKIYEGEGSDYFTHSRIGERICFQTLAEFVVRDLTSKAEFRFQRVAPPYVNEFANISPDGKKVVFNKTPMKRTATHSANDNLIVVKDLVSGDERIIGKGADPKWSSTSGQIVFNLAEGYVGHWAPPYLWVCNSDGAEIRKLKSSQYMSGVFVSWSPDRKYVMDRDRMGNLRIVDVAKDEAVVISKSSLGDVPDCWKSFVSSTWSPGSCIS